MIKKIALLALLVASTAAQADDMTVIPRVGLQIGSYNQWGTSDISEVTYGGNVGVSLTTGKFLADVNVESLSFSTPGQDVWRSEYAGTVGVAVYKSAYLIAGYRAADYGDAVFGNDFGKMTGPFVGVSLAGLQMGDDGKDIFNFSFAVNSNEFEDANGVTSDTDVGASMRIAYRRAGSPHSVGVRYQSFSTNTFDEAFTTLTYTYSFVR